MLLVLIYAMVGVVFYNVMFWSDGDWQHQDKIYFWEIYIWGLLLYTVAWPMIVLFMFVEIILERYSGGI